ncbi:MAG TPA: hypothetical protein VFO67_18825 [Gemmatimonadales bacterium]|nr:hypothetical protein [Gemmatimonadales bacterium]
MATTAIAIQQLVGDCRWSRPGHRFTGISEALQPESVWVCVREGSRRNVREAECRTCSYWELVPGAVASRTGRAEVASRVIAGGALAVWTRVVLVLIAALFVAMGFSTLTGPLAVPVTVTLWLGAAVFAGLAAFWRPD